RFSSHLLQNKCHTECMLILFRPAHPAARPPLRLPLRTPRSPPGLAPLSAVCFSEILPKDLQRRGRLPQRHCRKILSCSGYSPICPDSSTLLRFLPHQFSRCLRSQTDQSYCYLPLRILRTV